MRVEFGRSIAKYAPKLGANLAKLDSNGTESAQFGFIWADGWPIVWPTSVNFDQIPPEIDQVWAEAGQVKPRLLRRRARTRYGRPGVRSIGDSPGHGQSGLGFGWDVAFPAQTLPAKPTLKVQNRSAGSRRDLDKRARGQNLRQTGKQQIRSLIAHFLPTSS